MSTESKKWRFTPLAIPDVVAIQPPMFGDARGWFSETYNCRVFRDHGFEVDFVQDNSSFSTLPNTLRGLHYQSAPFAQDKLIRVIRGRVLDVAVDIRPNSATFSRHVAVELSAANHKQLFVPVGFAHGFVTREPDTLVSYKVSNFYAPDHDHAIFWADPTLGIDWGVDTSEAILSEKDAAAPPIDEANPLL